jgi:hypothetical protein
LHAAIHKATNTMERITVETEIFLILAWRKWVSGDSVDCPRSPALSCYHFTNL